MLSTGDGRVVPGEFFPHLLKEFSAVRRFQAVQTSADDIRLRLVVSHKWSEADQSRLTREIQSVVGPLCRFAIDIVDDIPLTGAGKHRVVVNLSRRSDQETAPRR
jgi:phenylacetate-CoA ligase